MVLQDRSAQIGLIVGVSFALLMSKIDSSIVNISLPVISREFSISISQASWIIISYLLILTCTLLLFGKICDLVTHNLSPISGYPIFTCKRWCVGCTILGEDYGIFGEAGRKFRKVILR
jgi:MFS family permease